MSKLAHIRQENGLSQSQLADKSGVNRSLIQFYEQGVRDINKAQGQTLKKIAQALGCAMEDLIDQDLLFDNKAYIMAFSNIKPGNSRIQSMIKDSKELIVAYYRTNIGKIIADANLLAQQEQFDKALYLLAQVPDVCTECTDNCRKTTIEIYQKKIDVAGLHLLQQARSAWAGSPNANGAVQAAQFLAKIDMLASCHPDAENLMQEMTAKVKDDERKAWEYELQKYADAKAKEQRDFEFRVRQYEEREAKEQAAGGSGGVQQRVGGTD